MVLGALKIDVESRKYMRLAIPKYPLRPKLGQTEPRTCYLKRPETKSNSQGLLYGRQNLYYEPTMSLRPQIRVLWRAFD